VLKDLFQLSDSIKLFQASTAEMRKAVTEEKTYQDTLNGQIASMRKLLYEESTQRDEYKAHCRI